MLQFALLLFVLGLFLLWLARRQQSLAGMPGGQVIYSDTRGWLPVEKPFYDASLALTGRPDYLVEHENQLIPVEVKSSRVDQGPYDSHIYQLAAYCLLIERAYGQRPAYGILHYPNRTYRIDFTSELESAILALLEEIHSNERRKELHRSHESPGRCAGCGYRSICEQRLR
jgi:CRISPR-associated exonuclease Cas4